MKYDRSPHWGSHLPILTKVVFMTTGDMLELGMGVFSTPFLHWMSVGNKRMLFSYESSVPYYDKHRRWENEFHKIFLVKDWDAIEIEKPWDVVLVDHVTERRSEEIRRLANYANYIVIHDSQPGADIAYGYDKIFPLFKYRKDFKFSKVWTSVLSNFKDLSEL